MKLVIAVIFRSEAGNFGDEVTDSPDWVTVKNDGVAPDYNKIDVGINKQF